MLRRWFVGGICFFLFFFLQSFGGVCFLGLFLVLADLLFFVFPLVEGGKVWGLVLSHDIFWMFVLFWKFLGLLFLRFARVLWQNMFLDLVVFKIKHILKMCLHFHLGSI